MLFGEDEVSDREMDDFFVDGPTGLTGFRDVMEDPER